MIDPNSIVKNLALDTLTAKEQLEVLSGIEKTIKSSRVQRAAMVKSNVDVVVNLLKKIEDDIKSRYDEIGNKIEQRVASIKDGRDGKDGKEGKTGKTGPSGPRGLDGKPGKDGRDGRDGEDGVSVVDAKIDFDGSLVISLSNGREINVGEVVSTDLAEKIKITMSTNSSLIISDEGSTITSSAKSINFTGTGVTATASGDSVTVNVTGGGGGGGVTSVTGTSPVVSSGGTTPAISLASGYGDTQNPYASKTQNYVLASPNGSSGVPTFRALVAADIPTLNQNTTGTASNVTGTVAIANGGTGKTTAPAAFANLFGFTTTATAAGTTTLTNSSSVYQVFTGTSAQTVQLPSTSTLAQGWSFHIVNNSTNILTINTSTSVLLGTLSPGATMMPTVLDTTINTAAAWEIGYKDFSVDARMVPQNAQAGNYTIAMSDIGEHIYHASGASAATYTIPANSATPFEIGTTITFVNMSVNNVTIQITTDTLYLAGTGSTGSRTLSQYGMATAMKLTSTTWIISGSGLT